MVRAWARPAALANSWWMRLRRASQARSAPKASTPAKQCGPTENLHTGQTVQTWPQPCARQFQELDGLLLDNYGKHVVEQRNNTALDKCEPGPCKE